MELTMVLASITRYQVYISIQFVEKIYYNTQQFHNSSIFHKQLEKNHIFLLTDR